MNSESAEDIEVVVNRRPMYIQDGPNSLFGWYHKVSSVAQRDCVAVICSPIGYEYAHSHRSMRHLADRLAKHGIPTVRFDYHGTGDSPGSDLDADRLRCWKKNVTAAIQWAREFSGRKRVCLLGVRLGATLAAIAASEVQVDFLVLWNPCTNGRRYLRENQAIAMTGEAIASNVDGILESAGFVMSAETITSLRSINLLNLNYSVSQRVLIVGRDDLSPEHSLSRHFSSKGVPNDYMTLPGYAAMMAEPQFTVVPTVAFSAIIDWVAKYTDMSSVVLAEQNLYPNDTIKFFFRGEGEAAITMEERFCCFGEHEHLFGIFSRTTTATDYPAIIFFNAGAVHHVGPNRLYVTLARNLTALGFSCFRFDLEGIGDSVSRSSRVKENHPYPDSAMTDVRAALNHLKAQGHTRFIAIGLCSGAHTAFHAGLTFSKDSIEGLILINPLTFNWVEGMSLETTRHFQNVMHYKRSARNPDSWRKLLKGKVNVVNIIHVALSFCGRLWTSYCDAIRERLKPESGSQLSRDLKKLIAMHRPITLIVAESDPGYDILLADARRTAINAQKSNQLRLHRIANADHTFTQFSARKELTSRIGAILRQHYCENQKL